MCTPWCLVEACELIGGLPSGLIDFLQKCWDSSFCISHHLNCNCSWCDELQGMLDLHWTWEVDIVDTLVLTAEAAMASAPYGWESLKLGIFTAPLMAERWEANVCKMKGPWKAPLNFYEIHWTNRKESIKYVYLPWSRHLQIFGRESRDVWGNR